MFKIFFATDDLLDGEIYLKLDKTCDENKEKEWLPAYYFKICLLSNEEIGYCDGRIGHNDNVFYGGNIGYGINDEHRGNNYAGKACKLLFKLAKKHSLDYLYITCDPTNIASAKTCLYAGGKYINTLKLPSNNSMYLEGKREVSIYKFNI